MTLSGRQDTGIGKRGHSIALSGEVTLKGTVASRWTDYSMKE